VAGISLRSLRLSSFGKTFTDCRLQAAGPALRTGSSSGFVIRHFLIAVSAWHGAILACINNAKACHI
jgi:hypothetical protein